MLDNKEIQHLKDEISELHKIRDLYKNDNEDLKKEIEDLENELEITINYYNNNYIRNGVPDRVYKALEKENEELKKDNEEYRKNYDRLYKELEKIKEDVEKV